MPQQEPIVARTTWLSRITSGSTTHEARWERERFALLDSEGQTIHGVATSQIRNAEIGRGRFHNSIKARTVQGNTIWAGGLPKKESERIYQLLHQAAEDTQEREAASRAAKLSPEMASLADTITQITSPDRYTRHSEMTWIPQRAQELLEGCDERTERHLEFHLKGVTTTLRKAANPEELEESRTAANREYLQRTESRVQTATRDILPNGLTQEQAQAIATDEDCTLVLAGTGKTAVIIGKIAHLVRNQGVEPKTILALAFNRKAALEVRERLPDDLKGCTISTFHSFGLGIIAAAAVAPTVSKLATDDFAYSQALDRIVQELLQDPGLSRSVMDLIGSMPAEYRSPFDFEDPAEYEQYVQDVELRTLSGDLVKSFEELTIANFLTENGVDFRYEAPYEVRTATGQYRQYQPDFHIPSRKIYIEHFAVNRNGEAPPGWDRYLADMEWKRGIHQENGTALVETFSWQHRDGTLLDTLQANLEGHGVEFNPVPPEELVQRLSQERINWLAHLLGGFLQHVKSGNLAREEIERRAQNARDKGRTEKFLQVFHEVRERYQQLLLQENAIDFHDLINRAADIMRGNVWQNPFTHLLVDEFQDISRGRMALLEALQKEGLAYFLVGDDWQSIYRFAGSQVSLVHDCDQHLGHTERTVLTRTFRFGEGILGPSGRFIQQNPEQTRRELTTGREGEGIVVMAAQDQREGMNRAVQEILERNQGRRPSILVLGRYRSRNNMVRGLRGRIPANVEFSTAHAAKGRESEYVIVLDLSDGRYGFPCMAEDDPLMELVLPPAHGQAFPHAEERRLFYVALTRAIRSAYLIADAQNPSPFVRELLKNSPEVENRGDLAPPCPRCPRGSLVPSASGENLRCSNFPKCGHMAPRCPGCRQGYVSINRDGAACSNPGCGESPRVCPRCGEGVLVPRTGRTDFWGCSRYQAEPSCRYTAPRQAKDQPTVLYRAD